MAGVNKNFVVKNGLEVNSDLIFADATNQRVGINTNDMKYTLHVNGGIGVTDLYASGIGTFNSIHLAGSVTAGTAGAGSTGQYLVRVGSGVSWQTLPATRSSQTFTASAGQTVFSFTYTVGQIDVFINGVKLSTSEYTANDTASVILNTACFGDETVELISYSSVNPGYGFTGIYGISLFEEGSPVGTTGQVVTLNFVGAAVTATATGAGATIYINDSVNPNYWGQTAAGIHTTSNVGVGTTNPRFALEVGAVGASGTSLWVNGNARVTGILTVGSSSIVLDGANNTINVGSGITINGNTGIVSASNFYASGIQVGVITASTIIYQGGTTLTQDWTRTAAGIHTLSNVGIGTTNPTSALTVKGTSALENVTVSGVSTFTGTTSITNTTESTDKDTGALIIEGGVGIEKRLNVGGNLSSYGDYANFGTNSSLQFDVGASVSPNVRIRNIYAGGRIRMDSVSGIDLEQYNSSSAYRARFDDTNVSLYSSANLKLQTIGAGVTVTGTTFTNQLSVSGISSFQAFNSYVEIGNPSYYAGLRLFSGGTEARLVQSGGGDLVLTSHTNRNISLNTYAIFGDTNNSGNVQLNNGDQGTTKVGSAITFTSNTGNVYATTGTFTGIVTTSSTLFANQLSVSGVSTFNSSLKIVNSTFTGTYEPNTISFRTGEVVIDSVSHTLRFQPSTTDNSGSILFFSRTGATGGSLQFRNSATLDFNLSGDINVSGITTTSTLNVSGVSTFAGAVSCASTVSFGTTAYFGEDDEIVLNNKFKIYNNGSNTLLKNFDTNTGGDLYIQSDVILLQKYDGTETIARFTEGAGVELNYQGQTRLTTIDDGVIVGSNAAGVAHIPNELRIGTVAGNQSNASIMIANSSGVGIGTTTSSSKLDLIGNLSVSGISTCTGSVRVGVSTAAGVILTSPNGTKYQLFVENDGTLKTVAV